MHAISEGPTENHDNIALELIKKGAALDLKERGGFTALILAVFHGEDRLNIIRALIDNGANLDIQKTFEEWQVFK